MSDTYQRALSIQQPWAWLIVNGYKLLENRTWKRDYRGPLLIHTGKKPDPCEEDISWAFDIAFQESGESMKDLWQRYQREQVFGALVGSVVVEECITRSSSPWFVGPYAFVLSKPVAWSEPIPYRGQLGFFPVNVERN